MGRESVYRTPAERQAAYRERKRNAAARDVFSRWRADYGHETAARLGAIEELWGRDAAQAAALACGEAVTRYQGALAGVFTEASGDYLIPNNPETQCLMALLGRCDNPMLAILFVLFKRKVAT
jgi:hypothetical protein